MFVVVYKTLDERKAKYKVFMDIGDAKQHANHIVAADEDVERADIYDANENTKVLRAVALVNNGKAMLIDASVKPVTRWRFSNENQMGALDRLSAVLEKFLNDLIYEARAKIAQFDIRGEFKWAIDATAFQRSRKRSVPDLEKWFLANVVRFGMKTDDRSIRRRAEELAANILNLSPRPIPPDPPGPKPLKRKRVAPKRKTPAPASRKRKTSAPASPKRKTLQPVSRKRTPRKLDLDF